MTYPAPKKNRANLIAVVAIAVVLVVGGVVAIVVATSGDDTNKAAPKSSSSADTRLAEERDTALKDGQAAVEVFNTMDYRNVEQDLDRWESVATGELLDEVRTGRAHYVTQLENARSTSTATVLGAALTEIDEKAGTARVMAALSVDVTIEGQQPTSKRLRLTADLERTGDGWKVSQISTM